MTKKIKKKSVWTREGVIFFIWKRKNKIKQINGLFEGGQIPTIVLKRLLSVLVFFGETKYPADPKVRYVYALQSFPSVYSKKRKKRGGSTMVQVCDRITS